MASVPNPECCSHQEASDDAGIQRQTKCFSKKPKMHYKTWIWKCLAILIGKRGKSWGKKSAEADNKILIKRSLPACLVDGPNFVTFPKYKNETADRKEMKYFVVQLLRRP